MVLGAHVVRVKKERTRARFFVKNVFCPKNGENRPKIGFWENINILILFTVFLHKSYFGKNLLPEIWAQPIRLQDFFILTLSPKQNDEKA